MGRTGQWSLEKGLQEYPDEAGRVSALIQDLDQSYARQHSEPGSVDMLEDPTVRALMLQGDAAVGPLLTALESDDRLTRAAGYSLRSFLHGRYVVPVHEAARRALCVLLRWRDWKSGEDRIALAQEMRRFWMQYRGRPEEDIWFGVLADDTASPRQWLHAAEAITQPQPAAGGAGTAPAERPMRGERLRQRSDPDVADLLTRRARELAVRDDRTSGRPGVLRLSPRIPALRLGPARLPSAPA